ncbi:MAG: response regulator [Desulfatiglans sp.]|jgi:DNA-binding NtrC family response regulator|nr:hypothetical protein [Thermodesulfobacteriota bacterium]MEE4353643.1 response regulator [Desulfatiglans sp.]
MDAEKTILIAEPKEVLGCSLSTSPTCRGFKTIQARTLKETLLAIQEEKVEVLILDASLLGEDGGFISIIRGMEEHLPIIVCAETNTPEFEAKIRQQRIFYYHIKSFGIEDLEMAISNAINRQSR